LVNILLIRAGHAYLLAFAVPILADPRDW